MESTDELEQFISEHEHSDPAALRLKYAGKSLPFDVDLAIIQIECRRKTRGKLPSLVADRRFLFPSVLSSEQCTCETIARFHASLITEGDEILDMTCGLGVDDIFMSQKASAITTFDIVQRNADFATDNFRRLGIKNINVVCGDSIDRLRQNPESSFDIIFADPARRGEFNRRTYALTDCSPDIHTNLSLIASHTRRLLTKVSPMLDITELCRQLANVSRVWVLSVKNECKEILVECDFERENTEDPLITAYNFKNDEIDIEPSVSFRKGTTFSMEQIYDSPAETIKGKYLYEPDSSVLKCGASAMLADRFDLQKLHPNTMLYISDRCNPDFPGRVFSVEEVYTPGKLLKTRMKGERRNVLCRNSQLKPTQIAAQSGIREGSGSDYLIGATLSTAPNKTIIFDSKSIT